MLVQLLVLLLFGFSVLSLPLEPLCPPDRFEYKGVRVNAIYRVQTNVTLEPVSKFAVPAPGCSGYSWNNAGSKSQIEEIKDDHNRLVVRLYSERFLNSEGLNSSALVKDLEAVNKTINQIVTIRRTEYGPLDECLREKFFNPIWSASQLIGHLVSLHDEQLPQTGFNLRLSKKAIFRMFSEELEQIAGNLTDSQAMAFKFDLIDDVYKKRIARIGKFVFHPKSKVVFDLSSTGTLHFEYVLPFEDTEIKTFENCVSLADLPDFFDKQIQIDKTLILNFTMADSAESTAPA